jgi:hypothetical protein
MRALPGQHHFSDALNSPKYERESSLRAIRQTGCQKRKSKMAIWQDFSCRERTLEINGLRVI